MCASTGNAGSGRSRSARVAVAIAGKEKIAAERAVGDGARRQPLVDLIDLVLRQEAERFGRQRETLGIAEGKFGPQARVSVPAARSGSAAAPRCDTPRSSTQLQRTGHIVGAVRSSSAPPGFPASYRLTASLR